MSEILCGGLLLLFLAAGTLRAETVVLHLKNGDRLAGTIVAEDTNRVIIATDWIKGLAVPLSAIERREVLSAAATNALPAGHPNVPLPVALAPLPVKPKPKHWKAEAQVGADFLFGAKQQQIYSGRFKLAYERPYVLHPKQSFRNLFDYSVDYGRTEGVVSANQMNGSDKIDFDVRDRVYAYNLFSAGYDKVRKINLRYEAGPGVGYHLFTHPNFMMNVEVGLDYQAEYRADGTTTGNFFPRLAEDFSWKLNRHLSLTEKLELFPPMDTADYRARFEGNLSYRFWQNLSLNLTLLDLYDSEPAQGVPNNDLQIHSSLGVAF